MRTTLTLADDVVAAVEKLRRERSIGMSDAVNELVRAGLTRSAPAAPFRQKAHDLGRGIDVSNVAGDSRRANGPLMLLDANLLLYAVHKAPSSTRKRPDG